ncbi:flagellar protein FlaG [Rhodocyclaceae bacterium]
MAVQNLGNFGGTAPQPVPSQGVTPRPVAPQRDAVAAEALPKANPLPEQPSREQVKQAVEEMRKSMSQAAANNLQFSVDDETGQTIVRVTDTQTGELIRQIPSEELVELAKSLDRMQGMLLRQQV